MGSVYLVRGMKTVMRSHFSSNCRRDSESVFVVGVFDAIVSVVVCTSRWIDAINESE